MTKIQVVRIQLDFLVDLSEVGACALDLLWSQFNGKALA